MPYLDRGGVKVTMKSAATVCPCSCATAGTTDGVDAELYMPNFVDRCRCATYDLRGMGPHRCAPEDATYDMREIAKGGLAVA